MKSLTPPRLRCIAAEQLFAVSILAAVAQEGEDSSHSVMRFAASVLAMLKRFAKSSSTSLCSSLGCPTLSFQNAFLS